MGTPDLDTIRRALEGAPKSCLYHAQQFGFLGYQFGEPRCESCQQPWRVTQALAALDRLHLNAKRPKERDEWAGYERGARCVAHGTERCEPCHLNPSTCNEAGEMPGCSVYAESGMHWDTCPNRIRMTNWYYDPEQPPRVCPRCAALVYDSELAAETHAAFHRQIDSARRGAEGAPITEKEQGDG